MTRHFLKTDSKVFKDSWEELKQFEIRLDDRNFQVNDQILLLETRHTGEQMKEGKPLEYTGSYILVDISYKLKGYGLKDSWCILGTCLITMGDDYSSEEHYKFEL